MDYLKNQRLWDRDDPPEVDPPPPPPPKPVLG